MASTLTAALKVPVVPDTAPLLTTEVALRAPVNVDTPDTVIVLVLTLRVSPIPVKPLPSPLKVAAVIIPIVSTSPAALAVRALPTWRAVLIVAIPAINSVGLKAPA